MPSHLRPAIITGTPGNSNVVWPGNLSGGDEIRLHTGGTTNLATKEGTTTNDNAAAGQVGEYIENTLAAGSGVSLTTDVAKTITSVSLTAGDWDVFGVAKCVGVAGTTMTFWLASISVVNDTLNATDLAEWLGNSFTIGTNVFGFAVPTVRISVASITTIYLVIQCTFAVSTMKGFGRISARRVR